MRRVIKLPSEWHLLEELRGTTPVEERHPNCPDWPFIVFDEATNFTEEQAENLLNVRSHWIPPDWSVKSTKPVLDQELNLEPGGTNYIPHRTTSRANEQEQAEHGQESGKSGG